MADTPDIVERLHGLSDVLLAAGMDDAFWTLRIAADEIERLRSELAAALSEERRG
jgi:hypothetical protein